MSPSLGRNLPHWDFVSSASARAVHEYHCTGQAGRGMCSTYTLSSEKFKNIPALKNFLRETRALYFSLCAQNTGEERIKRLLHPCCTKPIFATRGRSSLPHTISHPQSARTAAWPGFHAVSGQHCFL